MSFKSFCRLLIWEFEEYWDFPALEIVLFAAILSILGISFHHARAKYMDFGFVWYSYTPLVLALVVGVISSRIFAGSIDSREIIVRLSYPFKRWHVLLAKFTVTFLTIFAIFAGVLMSKTLLLRTSFLEPTLYIAILILFIHLMFLCTITMTAALALRNEAMSILVSILLFFALTLTPTTSQSHYKYLSLIEGNRVIFDYLANPLHSIKTEFTFQEFFLALSLPLFLSSILLTIALIYFQRIMQLD